MLCDREFGAGIRAVWLAPWRSARSALARPRATWYLYCPAWWGRGEVRSSTDVIRREHIHLQFAVIGSAFEAMLNAFRSDFWLQAVFRQKTTDFAKRSGP